ncbi:hypothetical protein N24_1131 [Corynebacterium suranareeae]|uniref:Uncharacterized protein n=1 Tax=Corynebacterium suranareeae TaxID=2506452 RepID=A0A160PQT9_9CORY|nr:hypothetical protein N24_1131 [Corynebacterium suranareeae]
MLHKVDRNLDKDVYFDKGVDHGRGRKHNTREQKNPVQRI